VRPSPVASLLLTELLLLAGCSRISHDAFVNEAKRICHDAAGPVAQLARPFLEQPASPPDLPRWAEVLGRLESLRGATVDRLRELDPPAGDREGVERWLSMVERSIRGTARARAAALRSDLAGFRAGLARGGRAASRAETIAGSFGLSGCRA
jgi:hypothetical protein